jgi:hypothetical protein
MSTVTTGRVATEGTSGGPPTSWRRRGIAVAVVVLGVGLGAWWLATTPRLEGGGIAGVSSADHEVVWASGLGEQVYVVPSDGPGSSTIAFGLRNGGPLPVELVDVWPNMDDPLCFWQPSERWFQEDPRHLGALDDRARPATGAVLAPGVAGTVWVTGAHPDPGGCAHEALNTFDDVEVVARIGGRTSTTRVPLGFTFGYTDAPEKVRDFYDVRVLRPGETSTSD